MPGEACASPGMGCLTIQALTIAPNRDPPLTGVQSPHRRRDQLCWAHQRLLPTRPHRSGGQRRAPPAQHAAGARPGLRRHQGHARWALGLAGTGQGRGQAGVWVGRTQGAVLVSGRAAGVGCRQVGLLRTLIASHREMFTALCCLLCCVLCCAGGADAQVGIVWNYFTFEPKRSWWTPFYVPWVR